jgi:hypothetical protein
MSETASMGIDPRPNSRSPDECSAGGSLWASTLTIGRSVRRAMDHYDDFNHARARMLHCQSLPQSSRACVALSAVKKWKCSRQLKHFSHCPLQLRYDSDARGVDRDAQLTDG